MLLFVEKTLAYLPQTPNICSEIVGAVLRAARINQIASYLICAIHRQTKSKRLSVGFTTASTEKHACKHSSTSTYVNTFDLFNTRPLVLPSSFGQTREEYFYIYSRLLFSDFVENLPAFVAFRVVFYIYPSSLVLSSDMELLEENNNIISHCLSAKAIDSYLQGGMQTVCRCCLKKKPIPSIPWSRQDRKIIIEIKRTTLLGHLTWKYENMALQTQCVSHFRYSVVNSLHFHKLLFNVIY